MTEPVNHPKLHIPAEDATCSVVVDGVSLDLGLAIKRLNRDMRDDWYPDAIAYTDLLDVRRMASHFQTSDGRCVANPAELFNIPKPNFTLRYSLESSLSDRLVYQSLADQLIQHFDPLLNSRVFSYRHSGTDDRYIFRNHVDSWTEFHQTARAELFSGNKVLLVTDIQNFYECITIGDLRHSLTTLCGNKHECEAPLTLLKRLLESWSPYKYYGIPQNRDASSFFANIFLHSVDEAMVMRKYNYFRYMDDIRIICNDVQHAKRALRDLIICLRYIRLNVNSKKTFVIPSDDRRIDDHLPPPHRELEEIDALLGSKRLAQVQLALPLLRDLTLKLIHDGRSDDRAFRFCINRLLNIARCDELAFDFTGITDAVIDRLAQEPWSTDIFTRFLEVVPLSDQQIGRVATLLEDPVECIYEWQGYLLWRLLVARNFRDMSLRQLALQSLVQAPLSPIKAGGILYLGACGTSVDRVDVARQFSANLTQFAKRAAVVATQEVSRSDAAKYLDPSLNGELAAARQALSGPNSEPRYYVPQYKLSPLELLDDLPTFYAN